MWGALLSGWNAVCAAVGAAYTSIAAFISLVNVDINALFASIHGGVIASGTTVQTFGAAALRAWGGV